MISETLAAVEKFSEILDFFQLQLRVFFGCPRNGERYCSKKNITPLATVEHKSKILDFFRLLRPCG